MRRMFALAFVNHEYWVLFAIAPRGVLVGDMKKLPSPRMTKAWRQFSFAADGVIPRIINQHASSATRTGC